VPVVLGCCLVVITTAIKCLERRVSEMTYYVLSDSLKTSTLRVNTYSEIREIDAAGVDVLE